MSELDALKNNLAPEILTDEDLPKTVWGLPISWYLALDENQLCLVAEVELQDTAIEAHYATSDYYFTRYSENMISEVWDLLRIRIAKHLTSTYSAVQLNKYPEEEDLNG